MEIITSKQQLPVRAVNPLMKMLTQSPKSTKNYFIGQAIVTHVPTHTNKMKLHNTNLSSCHQTHLKSVIIMNCTRNIAMKCGSYRKALQAYLKEDHFIHIYEGCDESNWIEGRPATSLTENHKN